MVTKHCINCGKQLTGSKFCIHCGNKVTDIKLLNLHKHTVMIVLTLVIIFLFVIGGVGFYNYKQNKLKMEEQQNIQNIKNTQEELNQQFQSEKQQRESALIQQEQSKNQQDKDGDGLTYSKELSLGTSDDNPDSDADGIRDNEDVHPCGGGQNYKFTINWQHKGLPYTTQFGIPEDWYLYYKNYDRSEYNYQDGRFATPFDPTIQTIAKDITDVSITTGDTYKVGIAIDFVESMIYQKDIEFNSNLEYPKYAIETIIDERGDCEDTSFLMASILRALNIDTILLLYSDHMAIGVWCDGCTGTYYNYKNRKYFFLETTGAPGSWKLGQIWGKYDQENPKIIEVN